MRNITFRLVSILGIFILLQACNQDDSAIVEGEPDAIVNNDPPDAPARGLTESWNDHDEALNRQFLDDFVAVYYDPEVNRDTEWPFAYFSRAWQYINSNYGLFGSANYLHVVGHGEDKSSFYKTYFDDDAGNRNIIDFPVLDTVPTPTALDRSSVLMAQIVENAGNGVRLSPGAAVWQDKFQEIFTYDLYRGLELADTTRVKSAYIERMVDFPKPGTYWFRDWFLPMYEDYNGTATISSFFTILAANYPIDGTDYARDMNLGEMVHFFSGATGTDLEPLAIEAFDFSEDNKIELLQARAEFPDLNYPFEPASEIIDVTSEGNAAIVVNKDNDGGPEAGEGSLKLIDGDLNSKFLTGGFPQEFYMQQDFEQAQVVNRYTFTSGNDAPDRDFKTWELLGSNDGSNFETLDTRTNESFTNRNQTKEFTFNNDNAYRFYRINLLENNGSSLIQISEWRLLNLKLLSFGPEDVTDQATLSVSEENRDGPDSNEGSQKLIDNDLASKFLIFDYPAAVPLKITQNFTQAVRVTKYSLTSANDAGDRDPKSWKILGSNDNETFTELDSRVDQTFETRGLTREFLMGDNEESYLYYMLEISENGGGTLFQLAEWRLLAE